MESLYLYTIVEMKLDRFRYPVPYRDTGRLDTPTQHRLSPANPNGPARCGGAALLKPVRGSMLGEIDLTCDFLRQLSSPRERVLGPCVRTGAAEPD